MKLRRVNDGEPRYLNFSGYGTHLYNTNALRRPGRLVALCEGEFDAMVLDRLVNIPAVGIPGVSQWRGHPEWWELFEGRQVLMFADVDRKKEGDDPGEKLAKEIAESLDSVRIVRLPEPEGDEPGMDVNLCYLKYGGDELRRRAGL